MNTNDMEASEHVTLTLEEEQTKPLSAESSETVDQDAAILKNYGLLVSAWADRKMEEMRPDLRSLREVLIISAMLDKLFAKITIIIFVIAGWVYFLRPEVLRVVAHWTNSTSDEDVEMKTHIEIVTVSGSFFIVCYAYTIIFHHYYVQAINAKYVVFLVWQFMFDTFNLIGKLTVMYQFCLVHRMDPNIMTLGVVPVGYQMITQIYVIFYLWNIYRGRQMVVYKIESLNGTDSEGEV